MKKNKDEMKKTKEYVKVILWNGKEQKRMIYVDESGEKYVYIKNQFCKLEDFKKRWNVKEEDALL